ncbi:radical SAM protein [Acetanaerobacterium elongatum]|uniref:DNA repair photolyase n=1 Tax=Acetanaerobacterium elongatum TaxID=258515 RepID=A0A1G9XCY1_9FIRM|nr:radical SAM protein [Acetanaerobacterium elongatum]SDM94557.1 DNA repair photolyase [Acetanaerobacterium elongatum]
MEIKESIIEVKDYLTKSNLPACDYVINPYVGCPHACRYCYACFMKRFTGHAEEWGTFIDVKLCDKPISLKKLAGKSVFLSSVTDCYNRFEEKYRITRGILERLVDADCSVGISTKSKLILRDIDLLKRFRSLRVSMSINTLDEGFKNDMDNASAIAERLEALKKLHENGIYTILFMSPIFPCITDFKAIIEQTRGCIDEYWFENLNLRGAYKQRILDYIDEKYPQYSAEYERIYNKGDKTYWALLAKEIDEYCISRQIRYKNYFYHEQLVKEKLQNGLKKELTI